MHVNTNVAAGWSRANGASLYCFARRCDDQVACGSLTSRPDGMTPRTGPVDSKPDEGDRELFREAVKDVKPLPQDVPARETRRPPPPLARFTRADRFAVLQESLAADTVDPEVASGEELSFAREGIQNGVLRKLRRGQYLVQAEIDLHGLTVPEAKEAVRTFLAEALERQFRCVRIVHGKGLRSGHRGPVLKGAVSSVLRRIGPVLAYVSARQVDGGTGALYVLLAAWPIHNRSAR